ncbi:MAG: hypothetical protein ACD_84C00025G0001 [uncultured bacterium]|nr:MAG: hypothetical protein ACD_84C00025G0001 [uncultured bacterium]
MEDLLDGELVTAVFYSDIGGVVSKRQLLVENTAFIRRTDTNTKYITGISLESPFLSASDPRMIQYPLNVPQDGLSLIGVVHYSDGSVSRLPVDGTKFKIFGLEGFISTIIGQKFNLVLKYSLSPGEIAYGVNSADGKFITETYKATTMRADGAFTVKLYGYPVWIDEVNGYRMEWFMYNLDRNAVYRVTPYVKFNANSHVFDPTLYGTVQHLSVSMNLRDVNGLFTNYIHVQTMDVALLNPGTARATNWTLTTSPGQTVPFGTNNFAAATFVNQNLWRVNLMSGAVNQAEWLQKLYFNTMPLTDVTREVAPPTPNYFAIVVGSTELEYPTSEWNITHDVNFPITPDSTLFIKFFYRTPDNDIQLSVAGIPIYNT